MSQHVTPASDTETPALRAAPDPQRDAIRALVRRMAAANGLSLSALARKAGVTPTTVTRFMNQDVDHVLSLTTLSKLSEASGVALPSGVPASGPVVAEAAGVAAETAAKDARSLRTTHYHDGFHVVRPELRPLVSRLRQAAGLPPLDFSDEPEAHVSAAASSPAPSAQLALLDKLGMLPDIASLVSGIRQIRALGNAEEDKSDAAYQPYFDAQGALEEKLIAAEPRTPDEAALKLEYLLGEVSAFGFGDYQDGFASVIQALRAGTLTPAAQPQVDADPDAWIERLADEHIANKRTFNASQEEDGGPLWAAYERSRDELGRAAPRSLSGMLAKARAAKDEAWDRVRGRTEPRGTPAEAWAWDLVDDLLRLNPPMNAAQPSKSDLSLEALCHDALESSRAEEEARRSGGKFEHSDNPAEQALYDAAQAKAAACEDRWLMALREMVAVSADGPIGFTAKMLHVLRNMQAGMVDEEIALAGSLYADLRRIYPDMPPIGPGCDASASEPEEMPEPLFGPGGTVFPEPLSQVLVPAPRSCEALARKLAELNRDILKADEEGMAAHRAGQESVAAAYCGHQTSLTLRREKTEDRVLDTLPQTVGDALAIVMVAAGRVSDLTSNEYTPEEIGEGGNAVFKALSEAFYVLARHLQIGADPGGLVPVDAEAMGPENYLQVEA
jgi:transcriptional regulator with XRE-family HTH domain